MPTPTRPQLDLTAHCACGAVAATGRGVVHGMLLCACIDCQKSTGAGHSAIFLLAAEDFTVTGPVAAFARPADSGAVLTRHFCPACGTPICARSSRASRLVMVPVGLFAAQAGWFRPNQLIFARTHAEWDVIAADLPRHLGYRDAGRP